MTEQNPSQKGGGLRQKGVLSWLLTLIICAGLISVLAWQPQIASSMAERNLPQVNAETESAESVEGAALQSTPQFALAPTEEVLIREPNTHTEIDSSLRTSAVEYTVTEGDSVFSIAQRFDIAPETLLWSNYDVLSDNPHELSIGQVLKIPPTDGIWYKWTSKDTLEKVAAKFSVTVDDIKLYVGNNLDLSNPVIEAGQYVMVPGGSREYMQWVIPEIPRGAAGVATSPFFQCDTSGMYYGGSGYFIWPSAVHTISGNNYWSGHLAIDIGSGMGSPIYAADSGVVVYAGWMNGGYGNVVIIDHNNGYVTVYAHLSAIYVNCGNAASQGMQIGSAGSTGNSTGAHLHFEIRYMGGFINPLTVLPFG